MNEPRDPVFATLDRLIEAENQTVRDFARQYTRLKEKPPEPPPEPAEPVRSSCSQLLSPQQKRRLRYLEHQGRAEQMAIERAEYIEQALAESRAGQRAANCPQQRRKKP